MKPVTAFLIVLNLASFVWLWLTGGWDSDTSLVAHGAIVPWYVRSYGEWWRIVTGAFLHAGLAHIGMNMLALAQLGTLVEELIGSMPMLAIYVVSMLGAGWAIVRYSSAMDPTVGASGAIYGLFGALIAIGLRMGSAGKSLVASTIPILVINLALTFAIPNISVSGHIGGLISGFLVALLMHRKRPTSDLVV